MSCGSARHADCVFVGLTEPCSFGSIVSCPRILDAITIVRPQTVVRWHKKGFAAYWGWKSRALGGRPRIGNDVRDLIRRMSFETVGRPQDPWRAAQAGHRCRPVHSFDLHGAPATSAIADVEDFPSQSCGGIASIDLFVVPTIAFEQLFAFLVLGHGRRRLLWFAVTRNPTAEWLARQITEAFPWEKAPKYLIRDNDRAFGGVFKARVRAMGIRDRPTRSARPGKMGMSNA